MLMLLLLFCPLQGHHTINTMAKAEGDNVLIKIDRPEKGHVVQASCAREGVNSSTQTVWKKIDGHHIINTMEKAEGDPVTIEFDGVANEFKNITNTTNLNLSPQRCIFKVPDILKRHNPRAYAPNAFSIGPYHYGEEHLRDAQEIKLKYLQELIDRSQGMISVRTLIEDIGKLQKKARECYAEPFDDRISMDLFVEILVLDGCFLIELFRKNMTEDLRKKDDPIFTVSSMRQFLSHDLILLENQIPWLVLERLFDITKDTENLGFPLCKLALYYCDSLGLSNKLESYIDAIIEPFLNGRIESKHILDLLRNAMVETSETPDEKSSKCQCMPLTTKLKEAAGNMIKDVRLCLSPNRNRSLDEDRSKKGENKKNFRAECKKEVSKEWKHMPSATRLREAGVNLNEGTPSTSIVDIKFFKDSGDLVIPKLLIQDTTESLFRNLICLEQCLPKCPPIVTCYAKLLDDLINTDKDVEILCESKILDNWLDIGDVTKLINKLGNDTCMKKYHYLNDIAEVNNYCKRRWPRYRTVLMRDYFGHPWAIISFFAALSLLGLTIVQTMFTISK